MKNKLTKVVWGLRNRHFLLLDSIVFLISPLVALNIRLDDEVAIAPYLPGLIVVTLLFFLVKIAVVYYLGIYKRCWRYAGLDELEQIGFAMIIAVVAEVIIFKIFYLHNPLVNSLPKSLPLLDGILSFLLIGSIRFTVPVLERISNQHKKFHRRDRVLIVGAGSAGVSLVKKLQQNPQLGLYPVAFIDDDTTKRNLQICGINIVGDRSQIPQIVRSLHIHRVIIAMPSASGSVIREIVNICQSHEILTSTLPGIHEIIYSRANPGNIREVQIEDLLRREPIQTDIQKVSQLLQGKTVLITGAGGSIGSELCRQIFKCKPARMVLLGHGENSVFTIEQELRGIIKSRKKHGEEPEDLPQITAFIADLRMLPRMKYVFEQFHPEVVFHAAAHKHVPMMELNPPEAITNNVRGTKNLLDLVLHYEVQNFVMISTDKAVNPTNIMGASKRVAEMLVLQAAQKSNKPFVVVRFGNVLGSRGSVIPTFKRQIAQGGPVTITHPDIRRYFMTIPEAVQLVLQAAAIGRGSEVFMLDMGQPVRIVDLATDLIRLSGYEVSKDIDIVFTGLRPGEKLFEELFIAGEKYERTQHNKILKVINASQILPDNIDLEIATLCEAAERNDANLIMFLLEQLIPEYTPLYSTANLGGDSSTTKTNVESETKIKYLTLASPELATDLQQAIEYHEFQIHYQPIISFATDKVIGFEALLRWKHPTRGLIFPTEFIPLAEDTGLIIPIGWWVLWEACRQMRAWHLECPMEPTLTISVNLTSKQFFQPELVKQICQILEETRLNASSLRLEIPEGVISKNFELAIAVLLKLQSLGVQLQIDNCGLSDFSLIYLRQVLNLKLGHFDTLKLDRSLVGQIDTGNGRLDIIKKIMATAHELGMDIIATGIETTDQITCLRSLKCLYGQGNFFSRPVESEAAIALVGAMAAHS
ncbi:polysaccharide biosynthesis protein [Aerosakkonemataceae cyanobacterium BLCC-F154]|uniref:Polysaccharide biosynthesis protein n=1 Tax=Floridaenema fluviatile BLCC-F154 TaxID=3153640 RepID=A0ABV4Y4V0_9CYAN